MILRCCAAAGVESTRLWHDPQARESCRDQRQRRSRISDGFKVVLKKGQRGECDQRPKRKADAEGRANQRHTVLAFFRRRAVGDDGLCRGYGGSRDPGSHRATKRSTRANWADLPTKGDAA